MNQKILILLTVFILFVENSSTRSCSDFIKFFPNYSCFGDDVLDKGFEGTVFIITKGKQKYILKHQVKSKKSDSELKYLNKVKGVPYVVQLIEQKTIKNDVLLILQYGVKGNLFDILENEETDDGVFTTQHDILSFFRKLIEGVQGIQSKGIIHADLKLENIVVDEDNNPLIIDFDLAVERDTENRARGSISYMPPEVLDALYNKKSVMFNEKTDVYSLGVILYALETGYFPFALEDTSYNPKDVILNSPLEFETDFSYDIMNVILRCLQIRENRASLQELEDKVVETLLNPTNRQLKKNAEYTMKEMGKIKVSTSKEVHKVDENTNYLIEHKYNQSREAEYIDISNQLGICLMVLLLLRWK